MFIIDVRTREEFNQGHLRNSINIEYQYIMTKIKEYITDKNVEIGLYCAEGQRSAFAQILLIEEGYTNTINLGGYEMLKKTFPYIE